MTNVKVTECPRRVNNLTGKRFGRLVVLGYTHTEKTYSFWLCQCDCGNTKVVRRNSLTPGHATSCGCRQQETLRLRTTHGESSSKEYACWEGMIQRCSSTQKIGASRYVGRGISICDRWRGSFEAFLEDMGKSPSDEHSIDRIDNDGNYEPGNCRWATRSEQSRNTSKNRTVTIDGVSKTLIEWVEFSGTKYNTVLYRLRRGWTNKEAIMTPTMQKGQHR